MDTALATSPNLSLQHSHVEVEDRSENLLELTGQVNLQGLREDSLSVTE